MDILLHDCQSVLHAKASTESTPIGQNGFLNASKKPTTGSTTKSVVAVPTIGATTSTNALSGLGLSGIVKIGAESTTKGFSEPKTRTFAVTRSTRSSEHDGLSETHNTLSSPKIFRDNFFPPNRRVNCNSPDVSEKLYCGVFKNGSLTTGGEVPLRNENAERLYSMIGLLIALPNWSTSCIIGCGSKGTPAVVDSGGKLPGKKLNPNHGHLSILCAITTIDVVSPLRTASHGSPK